MNDINDLNDLAPVVKILTELVVSDKELFLKFIRRLASEETQDKTEPAASFPQAERNKA